MTDIDDLLQHVRAAQSHVLSRKDKIVFIRSRGWRKTNGSGGARWQSPYGGSLTTLDAAYQRELMRG